MILRKVAHSNDHENHNNDHNQNIPHDGLLTVTLVLTIESCSWRLTKAEIDSFLNYIINFLYLFWSVFYSKPHQQVLSHWLVFKNDIWINKDKAELTKSKNIQLSSPEISESLQVIGPDLINLAHSMPRRIVEEIRIN